MNITTPIPINTQPSAHIPSKKSLIKATEKILESNDPLEYIKDAKVDLVRLYQELNNIALHAKVNAKDRDGDVLELGPDNRSRISAIALLLELAKHIKDKSTVINNGIFNDTKVVEDAERVLKLRGRI